MKQKPRLKFTAEEQNDVPPNKTQAQKQKQNTAKQRTFDKAKSRSKVRLCFEEEKQKPPSKLSHGIANAPGQVVASEIHKEVAKNEDDNVGVKSAHSIEKSGETSARLAEKSYRYQKLKTNRKTELSEKRAIKTEIDLRYREQVKSAPKTASNPVSRFHQKQAIKKEYIASRYGKSKTSTTATSKFATATKSAIKRSSDAVFKAIGSIAKSPKVLLVLLIILIVVVVIASSVSACSMLFQGMITSMVSTSYTSENDEIIATEQQYLQLENELERRISNIETEYYGYDEYRYDLDDIAHDPHELAAYLTAQLIYYHANEVAPYLETVFDLQYTLTITPIVEVRYNTETTEETTIDSDGNTTSETVETIVPYNYYILDVKLETETIDKVARELLTAEQLELYEVYRETKGNKPTIFD